MDAGPVSPVVGEYVLPVIDEKTIVSDPWSRNYFQPPPLDRLVPRKRHLTDIRPLLAPADYSPDDLLRSHGFAIVKHKSPFIEQLLGDNTLPEKALDEIYHAEMKQLFKEVTGAQEVFVSISVLRQGQRTTSAFQLPTRMNTLQDAKAQGGVLNSGSMAQKLAGTSNAGLSKPIRTPHLDYTPLGARQTIRNHSQEIIDAATRSGVIAAEDAICTEHKVQPELREADDIVAQDYNKNALGPRYAAYSLWRPLCKIERDPITLSPRKETRTATGEEVYWPYLNRIKGVHGDYLREYAMLGVEQAEPAAATTSADNSSSKWYYCSEQQPDEVMFIKQFDSAALGEHAEHAGAPWHASPEIGGAHGDSPRESIELRVLAFW